MTEDVMQSIFDDFWGRRGDDLKISREEAYNQFVVSIQEKKQISLTNPPPHWLK